VEAAVASVGAFLRIVLGSLMFAVWGSFSLATWHSARGIIPRLGILLLLFLAFLAGLALALLAIRLLVRAATPRRRGPVSGRK
jgi:hypothetical protein